MATPTICKLSGNGTGSSVTLVNDVTHVFATAEPRSGGTFRQQAEEALAGIERVMRREGTWGSVVDQAVFLSDPGQIPLCRQIMRDWYKTDSPAITYIPQPPCSGNLISIEALALSGRDGEISLHRISEQLVVVRHNGIDHIYAGHAIPRTSAEGVYEKGVCAFQHLRRLLPRAHVQFDQIMRTWLYLGGIVDDDGPSQRYKELNRARTDFYRNIPFCSDCLPGDVSTNGHQANGEISPQKRFFPASTGIGTNGRGITFSALAVASDRTDVFLVPLENPRQVSAFNYSQVYSPTSPKFSRAMAFCSGPDTTVFISGTASITDSETRHIGDVEAQTHETLDNIAALISEENLNAHGVPSAGTALEGLAVARVYIKYPQDYAKTRAACENRLGAMPITYVVADVCRPDLLVEIEGIAFSRKSDRPLPTPPGNQGCRYYLRPTGQASRWSENAGQQGPHCPLSCPDTTSCPWVYAPTAEAPVGN